MKKLRVLSGLLLFLLCSVVMGQTPLSLPLNLANLEPLAISNTGVAECRYLGVNRIEFWKNSNKWDTGTCTAILQISDAPIKLSLGVDCYHHNACTSKANELKVSISVDGINYTEIKTFNDHPKKPLWGSGSNESHLDYETDLAEDIRYLKFEYNADALCGHSYAPTITFVAAPISLPIISKEVSGLVGSELSQTFQVKYANPVGDVVLTLPDDALVTFEGGVKTYRIAESAGKIGQADITVYKEATSVAGIYSADITVADEGNSSYVAKTYTSNFNVQSLILPETNVSLSGIVGHAITNTFKILYPNAAEQLNITSTLEGLTTTIAGIDNVTKEVSVSYIPLGAENVSGDVMIRDNTGAEVIYHLDYMVSEPFTLQTTEVAAETGVVGIANSFSFTVNRLKGVALAFTSENENLVFEQTEMLPAEVDGEQLVNVSYTATVPGADAADIIIKDAAGIDTYSKSLRATFLSRPAVPVSTVDIKKNSIKVSWQPMNGVTAYLFSMTNEDGSAYDSYTDYAVEGTAIEVTGLTPETTYYYTLKAKYSDELISDASIQTKVVPTATCAINVGTYNDFEASLEVGQTQAIGITVPNAEGDVTAILNGSENFRLLNTTVASGESINVRYVPVAGGIEEAELTFSSPNANDVTVTLKGYAYSFPATVLTEKTSFTIAWGNMGEVKSELSFDSGEVEDVTGMMTKTFDNLTMGSTHTYQMTYTFADEKVIKGEVISVTTTTDYGQQLNNSGFENWEGSGDSAEPTDWNSFMTLQESFSMASLAKAKQVEVSAEVRPESKGTASARIWTRNAFAGIRANGNLTTGRINAGSMTATDLANHNFTVTEDPAFSEAMYGAKPDSLTVWVKYVPKTATDKARISAILHDKYNLKDPSTDAANNSHIVAEAIMNYNAASDNGWQRLAIPFDYSGPATSADYMLVTYTTNMTPGGGSVGDEAYIDDMLLIYKPEVAVTGVNKTAYKQGEQIKVTYNLEGTMSPTNLNAAKNVVTLQLSDATGSFDNAMDLTSVTTDYSGTLTATLPTDLATGDGYRVRVVTTNYPMISAPNSNAIRVYQPGVPTISTTIPADFVISMNETATQTISIEGSDLESEILLTLDNAEEGFSLDKVVLPADGGEIDITYASAVVGMHTVTVTLTATGVEPVKIIVSGTTRPLAPEAYQADEITSESFMAHWEGVEVVGQSVSYRITVKTDGEIVNGYPKTTVNTSFMVDELAANTIHTYFIETIVEDIHSDASNEIEVRTTNPSGLDKVSANIVLYPVPANDVVYIKGCEAKEVRIYSVDGMYIAKKSVEENRIDVSTLAAGTYLVTVVSENGQLYKARIIKE